MGVTFSDIPCKSTPSLISREPESSLAELPLKDSKAHALRELSGCS